MRQMKMESTCCTPSELPFIDAPLILRQSHGTTVLCQLRHRPAGRRT